MDVSRAALREARHLYVLVAIIGLSTTAFAFLVPGEALVSRQPAFHAAVETGAGLVALLVAFLMWGRFRLSGRLADLLLAYAMALFAAVNLLLSMAPVVSERVWPYPGAHHSVLSLVPGPR